MACLKASFVKTRYRDNGTLATAKPLRNKFKAKLKINQ